jgi:hypothetical protein
MTGRPRTSTPAKRLTKDEDANGQTLAYAYFEDRREQFAVFVDGLLADAAQSDPLSVHFLPAPAQTMACT